MTTASNSHGETRREEKMRGGKIGEDESTGNSGEGRSTRRIK